MKYDNLVQFIQDAHLVFQREAIKAVNIALTCRNWVIGYYIVQYEQGGEDRAKYGEKLLINLAAELKNSKGLDSRSLYRFRQLYLLYPQIGNSLQLDEILGSLTPISGRTGKSGSLTPILPAVQAQTTKSKSSGLDAEILVTRLSYTHFEQLIRIDEDLKRSFYEVECIKGNWSVRELKRQINSLYFERSGLSQNPAKLSEKLLSNTESMQVTDAVKSVYTFEFLGLKAKEVVEEKDLEIALLNHLQEFMLELGNGFCFEARQKRILIDEEYYFVDLVFYHRILKCHILLELKLDAFKHEHLSQLNTYVAYYREEVKQKDDNPPIGILLCTEKGKKLVEYALSGMDEKLFVSKYLVELPSKERLEAFIKREMETLA